MHADEGLAIADPGCGQEQHDYGQQSIFEF